MRGIWQIDYYFGHVQCGRMIVHLLVILFGISAWIGINGIFVELPLLVDIAPEGWNLPAYIVIVTQSANIGPVIYVLLRKIKCQPNESPCILCVLCLQVIAMGLLIFFYDRTVVIGGEKHSLILLISVFFNALVGCFSPVLFMPYLRDYDDIYIVSFFIGEGLSGVLPSIMALIQGIGESAACNKPLTNTAEITSVNAPNLRFSEQYYFLFLTLVIVLSLIAFVILQYSTFAQVNKSLRDPNFPTETKRHNQRKKSDVTFNVYHTDNVGSVSVKEKSEIANNSPRVKADNLSLFKRIYLYILIGVCCFFNNGFLPSIQSYSCLPYGHLAYQLSIVCSLFANPLACFLTIWIVVSNIKIINCLCLVCLITGCYVICVALLSPTPPLQNSTIGMVLIILSWIVLMGVISYLRLVTVSLLKHIPSLNALFNVGIVMQTGSAIGAIISFVLINVTDTFKTYDSCSV